MAAVNPTPSKIALGEGAFYINYDVATGLGGTEILVGATRGGGNFNREVEIKEVEFDGSMGMTKGMRRKTRAVPVLTLNALEIADLTRLTKFYAGMAVDTADITYDKLTANDQIADTDYLTNVTFIGETAAGKEVIILIKNALGDGNMELALEDKEEIVPEVTFTGHYDNTDIKTEPFEIYLEK